MILVISYCTMSYLSFLHIIRKLAKQKEIYEGITIKSNKNIFNMYLNKIVYKLNRIYFDNKIFDRLVIANIIEL